MGLIKIYTFQFPCRVTNPGLHHAEVFQMNYRALIASY